MDEQPTPLFGSRIGSLVDIASSARNYSTNGTMKADDVYERPARLSPIMLLARLVSLFAVGVGYGLVVAHFHDQKIMSRGWEAIIGEHGSLYLIYWGLAGITLGLALPALDRLLKSAVKSGSGKSAEDTGEWNVIVRSIGAFIGIAFAIVSLSFPSRQTPDLGNLVIDKLSTAQIILGDCPPSFFDIGTCQPLPLVFG